MCWYRGNPGFSKGGAKLTQWRTRHPILVDFFRYVWWNFCMDAFSDTVLQMPPIFQIKTKNKVSTYMYWHSVILHCLNYWSLLAASFLLSLLADIVYLKLVSALPANKIRRGKVPPNGGFHGTLFAPLDLPLLYSVCINNTKICMILYAKYFVYCVICTLHRKVSWD